MGRKVAGRRAGGGQVAGSMADPFRQAAVSVSKNTHFSRELDPFPPIHLAGGDGDESSLLLRVQQYP